MGDYKIKVPVKNVDSKMKAQVSHRYYKIKEKVKDRDNKVKAQEK